MKQQLGLARCASNSTQRYRVRERKWQTRETLASSVYPRMHPCTQMEKKQMELQETLKACINLLTLY